IHSKDVMGRAEGAFRLVSEANSDLRAFAVSGNPEFGEAYLRDRARVGPAVAELRDLVRDNPPQQARLDGVRERADEALRWLDDIHRLIVGGNADMAVQRIDQLEGKERVDAMRAALDEFLSVERDLDAERQDELRQTMHEQNRVLAFGAGLAVASAAVLLF